MSTVERIRGPERETPGMSYADELLATGERVLHRGRQHPLVIIWSVRWLILAGIAIGLVWLGGNLDPDGLSGSLRQLLGWMTALLFFGCLASVAWSGLRWVNGEYVLTNRRVVGVEGFLARAARDSSLEKIDDAVLHQSVFGRMFDFGDLTVRMTSEVGIGRMAMIRDPVAFKRALLQAKDDRLAEIQRGGWLPGPPIRETTGTGVAGPGAGGGVPGSAVPDVTGTVRVADATGPTPAAKAHPSAVAQTLATLADLRDKGVISAADYDAKKRDLLSRL